MLATSCLICFGMWRWAEVIAAPTYTSQALAKGRPIGNNSDLYPRWLGARELLLRGRDPYGPEVTREIQMGFYGRPLNSQNPSDPTAQESFVYPLYVVFLLAPTIALPFAIVQEFFRWFLLFCLACTFPLWMYAIRFRARLIFAIAGMVLTLSGFAAIFEYHQQNLAALVLFLLALAGAATVRGHLLTAGFLLAWATIKPELSGLTILWFLLWAVSCWTDRKSLIWGFVGTIALLFIAAEIVSPHWTVRFLAALREYPTYGADNSVLQMFLPSSLAAIATAALLAALFARYWRWRKMAAGSEYFGWSLAWAGTVTLTVIPKQAAYNQPLLIPAFLVLIAQHKIIANGGRIPRALVKGIMVCLLWQWGSALALSLGTLLLPVAWLRSAIDIPNYTALAVVPLTLLTVIATTLLNGTSDRPTSTTDLPVSTATRPA